MQNTIETAARHINDILSLAIKHTAQHAAVVIFDTNCPLAVMLTEAYRHCLPGAKFIDFYTVAQDEVNAVFNTLVPSDLVVLIQSTSFRMDAFRLRVELFKKSLKVIEHPHLARMIDQEAICYIDSLAYDPGYYHRVGHALKALADNAKRAVIDSGGERLVFEAPLEPAKLNIGDYTGMTNIGGQFPIGEVFTESQDLEAVNGRVRIFAFADTTYSVNVVDKPITLVIEKGRVIEVIDSTEEFDKVLANIRADEDEVWLRELGFGMNRAFTRDRIVCDVGTYERMCGVHLSLGAKHTVYKKANFTRNTSWHHVDVFVVSEAVYLDERDVFVGGEWRVL